VLLTLGVVIYVTFRLFGKLIGSYLGGRFARSTPIVNRYLGFCLLPQAQAAIGLAFYAHTQFGSNPYGTLILVIVLIASVINELFGPLGLRYAILQCNGIDGQVCEIL